MFQVGVIDPPPEPIRLCNLISVAWEVGEVVTLPSRSAFSVFDPGTKSFGLLVEKLMLIVAVLALEIPPPSTTNPRQPVLPST